MGFSTCPSQSLSHVRKNPIRRNLPRWLEGRESFLKGHYRLTLQSGQLESDLDTDGFACERLECHYKTALSTVYLAEDGWNHREQNRPGTELELALIRSWCMSGWKVTCEIICGISDTESQRAN